MVTFSSDAILIAGAILIVGIALLYLWYRAERKKKDGY